jgi:hypothetical protein
MGLDILATLAAARARQLSGGNVMAAEYNGQIENLVPTVVVSNWKGSGRRVRMNAADYWPERDGDILEGPTMPPTTPGVADPPNKDPRLDADGRAIADHPSPMLRA